MKLPAFEKYKQDPADVLDYPNDWRAQPKPFLQAGEKIVSSTWTAYTTAWVPTTDLTLADAAFTDTTTVIWISDGLKGATYFVTNHIVTDQGREKDETIIIIIEEQ